MKPALADALLLAQQCWQCEIVPPSTACLGRGMEGSHILFGGNAEEGHAQAERSSPCLAVLLQDKQVQAS